MMTIRNPKPAAVIPPQAAPLRTLAVTMTVMCYLACLAIGALIIINHAVEDWTSGISREITVQLRQLDGVDIEAELQKSASLLEATKGVRNADILSRDASLKLLEPWLGKGNLDDLPVPRLIRVTIDENVPPDFDGLAKALAENIKGASLDTHRRWEAELSRMAHTLSLLSFWILALISIAAIAMVVFASRAVLDANRGVVDVLQLVGAEDNYIARQIDRRFLVTGFGAGCFGLALAVLTFLFLGFYDDDGSNGVAAASYQLLFLPRPDFWVTVLSVAAVPVCATVIALTTARITLTHMLRSET